MERRHFLQTAETGALEWESFIDVFINQKITFEEISSSAIANYLKGIANEGLMELIPSNYSYYEDLEVAVIVVFEDPSNICKNSSIYTAQLE